LFFRDVRVPVANVLGAVGDGWNVALGTLAQERAALGVSAQIAMRRQLERLVELAHQIPSNGHTAAEDPLVRQKLAQSYVDNEVLRLNQMRAVSKIIETGRPGPEGSILKIGWSEANQRFQRMAQEILGPRAQLTGGSDFAIDNGAWGYSYLRSRGNTIEAGTSEIQRNIIAQHVLGLPKSY
jgi:alkylation response protein AidB-like acyl-CoA dehydrogenase